MKIHSFVLLFLQAHVAQNQNQETCWGKDGTRSIWYYDTDYTFDCKLKTLDTNIENNCPKKDSEVPDICQIYQNNFNIIISCKKNKKFFLFNSPSVLQNYMTDVRKLEAIKSECKSITCTLDNNVAAIEKLYDPINNKFPSKFKITCDNLYKLDRSDEIDCNDGETVKCFGLCIEISSSGYKKYMKDNSYINKDDKLNILKICFQNEFFKIHDENTIICEKKDKFRIRFDSKEDLIKNLLNKEDINKIKKTCDDAKCNLDNNVEFIEKDVLRKILGEKFKIKCPRFNKIYEISCIEGNYVKCYGECFQISDSNNVSYYKINTINKNVIDRLKFCYNDNTIEIYDETTISCKNKNKYRIKYNSDQDLIENLNDKEHLEKIKKTCDDAKCTLHQSVLHIENTFVKKLNSINFKIACKDKLSTMHEKDTQCNLNKIIFCETACNTFSDKFTNNVITNIYSNDYKCNSNQTITFNGCPKDVKELYEKCKICEEKKYINNIAHGCTLSKNIVLGSPFDLKCNEIDDQNYNIKMICSIGTFDKPTFQISPVETEINKLKFARSIFNRKFEECQIKKYGNSFDGFYPDIKSLKMYVACFKDNKSFIISEGGAQIKGPKVEIQCKNALNARKEFYFNLDSKYELLSKLACKNDNDESPVEDKNAENFKKRLNGTSKFGFTPSGETNFLSASEINQHHLENGLHLGCIDLTQRIKISSPLQFLKSIYVDINKIETNYSCISVCKKIDLSERLYTRKSIDYEVEAALSKNYLLHCKEKHWPINAKCEAGTWKYFFGETEELSAENVCIKPYCLLEEYLQLRGDLIQSPDMQNKKILKIKCKARNHIIQGKDKGEVKMNCDDKIENLLNLTCVKGL